MNSRDKSNWIEFIGFIVLGLVTIPATIYFFIQKQIPASLGSAVLALIGIYFIGDGIVRGLRPPTRFEWFKFWMNMRPILLFFIGLAVLALIVGSGNELTGFGNISREIVLAIFSTAFFTWVILVFWFLWKAPRRYESDTSYKARIGWKEN